MRTLRIALVASRLAFEQSEVLIWTKVVATVIATTSLVLGASFVAVAMSLA